MKKKFNVKIYGRKGFNSTKEPYLIDTVNIYINLYECGKWYKSNDVKEIKVKSELVSGIETNSDSFSSDYVISNMDVFHTYKKLLPNEILPINRLKQERSSSAVIFYWGIKKQF